MAVKQIVEDALKRPMSRRQFLGQIGALFLAVIGVTAILHALGEGNHQVQGTNQNNNVPGYGMSPYGGSSEG